MKHTEKAIILGILGSILFFICTLLIIPIGNHILPGDEHILSYTMFIYMGLTLLAGLIITCTYIIVSKLNQCLAK
ncbi:MAG: hypothetical protein RR585_10965 [Coprobacillus sp.]